MFSEQMLPVKECYEVGICSGVLKNFILKSYQTKLVVDGIFTTLSLWLGGAGWRAKSFLRLTRLMSMQTCK